MRMGHPYVPLASGSHCLCKFCVPHLSVDLGTVQPCGWMWVGGSKCESCVHECGSI